MSYEIEYDRVCFKKAGDQPCFDDSDLYLFIKQGCNNIDPRPKDWCLVSKGWNYSVVQDVCYRAGSTEGGMLKLNGKNTTPENYLKLYRKTIANADPLTYENVKNRIDLRGFRLSFIEQYSVDRLNLYYAQQFNELESKGWVKKIEPFCGKPYIVFTRPFDSLDDLEAYIEAAGVISEVKGCRSLT